MREIKLKEVMDWNEKTRLNYDTCNFFAMALQKLELVENDKRCEWLRRYIHSSWVNKGDVL